jgi:hypothetical protein
MNPKGGESGTKIVSYLAAWLAAQGQRHGHGMHDELQKKSHGQRRARGRTAAPLPPATYLQAGRTRPLLALYPSRRRAPPRLPANVTPPRNAVPLYLRCRMGW